MEGDPTPEAIRAEILRLAGDRGADRSICPSEVARALAPEAWRPLMHRVRREAAALATEGQMEILRKGKPIAPEAMHGVIRLRIAR
ncbi:DUF3253 domain-containing protein [Sabulicella glaciei]|uniref:DUF3253 domain-containing protein n=1 Tax=Sabulicella glaciei TaxID=2984948 RepID=A0ABT3NTD2_9PROT|nr:DUF3253 domain-containing protein [Roseococcus sp. MDT2-1-1]MCW8085415.1 DUF3253 domain-containing protein [Roseococcus sp. MDT2-1-1]